MANDFPGVNTIMVDTKANNTKMIEYLSKDCYTVEKVTDLYHQGTGPDVISTKSLA